MEKSEMIISTQKRLIAIAEGLSFEDKKTLLNAAELLNESLAAEKKRLENERKPAGSHTRWSDEEESALKAEYQGGASIEALAAKHERSYSGIISRLVKLNLIPDGDINGGCRWSDEEEARLRAEFSAGQSLAKLSAAHGRSYAGIVGRLIKLGLIEA